MKLVTLEEWAAEHFRTPPSINTLRRWARDGCIIPAPVKHGRSYYVRPDAEYSSQEPAKRSAPGDSLISRIKSARHGTKAA
ncbi:TPA: excisionase [Pseudomonas aeruginosa]|uniref:excisionase n=1 Tax=Pseudomonas aeruginosa TaxID=287 RepID=UPI0015F109AF|nr:excisionase [Pseudomonas aeruginosa]MBA4903915.1 excisionase [Pseudomonas aeruginosa]HCL3459498.1 excisionase [Pseudomonas aeruginosa]